jgi:DNA polymerase alpha subunit B
VLAELAILCQRYNIDANKISCEYFSFTTSTKMTLGGKLLTGRPPSLESLVPFEAEKLRNLKPAGRRPLDPIEGAANLPDCPELAGDGTPAGRLLATKRQLTPEAAGASKRLVTALGTPGLLAGGALAGSPAPVAARRYTERQGRGEVLASHRPELPADWGEACRPEVVLGAANLDRPYRFMYERLRDRAAVLDETICRVGDQLVRGLGRQEEPLLDLASTHPEPGLAVGRVQCDGEGRLNSNSVVLQGSMDTCGGAALPLDLSQVPQFSLFPGQVVAADCTNPNGSRLVAQAVHPGPATGEPAGEGPAPGTVLTVLAASGPFTTSDSAGLEPLEDFLAVVQAEKPGLVVMFGPFLDSKNVAIVENDKNFDAQWHDVLSKISKQTAGLETEVVLVPSARDVHGLPVYPQPPYQEAPGTAALLRPNLRCLSDPASLTVSGVSIGLSATDILFHLGKEEISFPPRSGKQPGLLTSGLTSRSQGTGWLALPPTSSPRAPSTRSTRPRRRSTSTTSSWS